MLPKETRLICHQCVVMFEKNAQAVTKLVWGAVPPEHLSGQGGYIGTLKSVFVRSFSTALP